MVCVSCQIRLAYGMEVLLNVVTRGVVVGGRVALIPGERVLKYCRGFSIGLFNKGVVVEIDCMDRDA